MEYNKARMRQIFKIMAFGALLMLGVIYSSQLLTAVKLFINILMPFIIGGVIAFILNIPLNFAEKKLMKGWKNKIALKLKRPLAILFSLMVIVVIICVVVSTVVPQITKTVTMLGQKIPDFLKELENMLYEGSKKYPQLKDQLVAIQSMEFNWDVIVNHVSSFLKNGLSNIFTSTVSVASSIFGGIMNSVISFIFAIYILGSKERLSDQGKRVLHAFVSQKKYDRCLYILQIAYRNFSNFITGQCMEAVILGTMFIIAMKLFRMPYAVMVGILIAFTALIPIVGAFIGCAVGAFLILIENPIMAIWFVVLFLVLQQIEGNLIYPKVVGNSVGLPAIWVLAAVSIGGSLFGVAGMLFFIPLMATLYTLLREYVNERNSKK